MKELLPDNVALQSQLEDLPAQATMSHQPHRLREIDSSLTWVFCFLAYRAVRTMDPKTHDMLTYARLLISATGDLIGWNVTSGSVSNKQA